MKSKKKFVLAGLMLLATVLVLPLVGCDTGSGGGSVAQKPATNTPGGGTGGNGGNGEEYTVTFNANGGTFADGKDTRTETVESGRPPSPTPPTKDGWVFAGWYTSEDDGTTLSETACSFDTPVADDIILYAAWNGRDSDGNIVLRNKVILKTSEVPVLSTAADLSSLYVVDSKDGQTDTSGWGEVPDISVGDYGWWNKIECDWNANGYRLPTEAEWELAARGSDPKAEAWYYNNSYSKTHPVGTKNANSLELHDMSGHVFEWCWDWWSADSITADTPSSGAVSGYYRVCRGGSWGFNSYGCTVSDRGWGDACSRDSVIGFRLVRSAN